MQLICCMRKQQLPATPGASAQESEVLKHAVVSHKDYGKNN